MVLESILKELYKYGIENFKREILQICETREAAYNLEKEIVTPELIESKTCYNLNVGGHGGWYHVDTSGDKSPMKNLTISKKVWAARKANPIAVAKQTQIARKNIKKAHQVNQGKSRPEYIKAKISKSNKGQKRSLETRLAMSIAAKNKPSASIETRKKRSENAKKRNQDMSLLAKSKPKSDSFKKAVSERMKRKYAEQTEKFTCMHCGLESKIKSNITRWHNENCRHKKFNEITSTEAC